MAEVRETLVQKRRGRGGWFLMTFLVGGLLIGVVAVMLMNIQGTLYWPAGHVDFNLRPTASTASTVPPTTTAEAATAASAPAPAESTDTATAPEPSSAPADANPPASTAPAETQPQ